MHRITRKGGARLPSLDHGNSSSTPMSFDDSASIVCTQPAPRADPRSSLSNASTMSGSSRRTSAASQNVAHSQSQSSLSSWKSTCPAPPLDIPDMASGQPAFGALVGGSNSRSVSQTGGSNSRSVSRTPLVGLTGASTLDNANASGGYSSQTRQLSRRGHRVNSDPTGSSSRAPSGSQTPAGSMTPSGRRTPDRSSSRTRQYVPPLTSAQLETASAKLQNLEASDQPPSGRTGSARTGWEAAEQESSATPSSVLPSTPGLTSGKSSPSGKSRRSRYSSHESKTDGQPLAPEDQSSESASSSFKKSSSERSHKKSFKDSRHHVNPRHHLGRGSRDDSFLSTISESTMSTSSAHTDDKGANDGQIEVFCDNQTGGEKLRSENLRILKDFRELFKQANSDDAAQMQLLLRQDGVDKPLEMQRRIIPAIMSAFQEEQKSFISVQGAAQSGKTHALALGILGAVGADLSGIRVIALSTGPVNEFQKCFDIVDDVHLARLISFESAKRKVSFAGVAPDPDSNTAGVNINEDMQRLCSELGSGVPGVLFGHPSRVLPLLREAPSWGIDLSNVQVLAIDDAEDAICQGLIDEVCEVCTILRHFSKQRLRHIVISRFLSSEAKSMLRCLRTSLLKQTNLFGIQANRTQARAKTVNHYYAVAPRARWPGMLAVLHHALNLPSGIIFDDESSDARARTRLALRALGVTASVWNDLQDQRSGARAAARDGKTGAPKGPAFHLMPSDLAVLKWDLPQVRCVLHFEVPRRELSVYGLRLMCLEQQDQKKASRKTGMSSKSLSVLFVEEAEVVRDLEKTFHIRMEEVPTEMLPT